jgi:eukaryotic-like serine/threonine-protein kinase
MLTLRSDGFRRALMRISPPLIGLALAACGGDNGNGGGSGAGTGFGGAGGSGTTPSGCETTGKIGDMVPIEAGEFLMGCNPAVDRECRDDESPGRAVTLSAFEIDITEVTQDEYAACAAAGQCTAPSCDWDCSAMSNPANCVTQDQAQTYCIAAGKRLPTEAEWEKAARGTDGRKYPWGNDAPTCEHANMAGCSGGMQPVGQHPLGASPYGVLDMSGNMVEIVADWYDPGYYQTAPTVDPTGPASGSRYVGRGGGWKSAPTWQRASMRDVYDPEDAGLSLGFRCAR